MDFIKVADKTYALDPFVFGIGGFTSVYLLVGDTLALIDSGSPKSTPFILKGITSLGYRPQDITKIILSHIHFDHGSGAGELLKFMPRASIYAQHNGCKHLIDPTRLTLSAKSVFGKMIDEWYGVFTPVAKEKIVSVSDGDVISLGGNRKLKVYETTGHAKHEICLFDQTIGGLFTGDEAGVLFPDIQAVIPTSPPPDFDPDHNLETIKRLKDLRPELLLFAHYLTTKSVDEIIKAYTDVLIHWKGIVQKALHEGMGFNVIVSSLRRQTEKILEALKGREDLLSWIMDYQIPMCARGYINYFEKTNHTYPPDLRVH